jgi:hypothetical protein
MKHVDEGKEHPLYFRALVNISPDGLPSGSKKDKGRIAET